MTNFFKRRTDFVPFFRTGAYIYFMNTINENKNTLENLGVGRSGVILSLVGGRGEIRR